MRRFLADKDVEPETPAMIEQVGAPSLMFMTVTRDPIWGVIVILEFENPSELSRKIMIGIEDEMSAKKIAALMKGFINIGKIPILTFDYGG